jgi:hypothetical protein
MIRAALKSGAARFFSHGSKWARFSNSSGPGNAFHAFGASSGRRDSSSHFCLRRIDGRAADDTVIACVRFGPTIRGAPRNFTPTSFSFRQTTSHGASKPSDSIISSNVSGALTEPSIRTRAPDVEMSRTMQGKAQKRAL